MHSDEDGRKPVELSQIGGDLSALSVDELDQRIAELQAEIERLNQTRTAKVSHLTAAASIFGKTR